MSETENQPRPRMGSATRRRLKYGLNVAVATCAVFLLVVLVSWITHQHLYQRFDFTATRQYTLSEQTHRVLEGLEGEHRVVTLFRGGDLALDQVRDLVDEYARYSSQIHAEHLNPDFDMGRRERLYAQVREHFGDELGPLREGVLRSRETLQRIVAELPQFSDELEEALADPDWSGRARNQVQEVDGYFRMSAAQLEQLDQQLEENLSQSLPDYTALKEQRLEPALEEIDDSLLRPASNYFDRAVDDASTPNTIKETLLQLDRQLEALRDEVDDSLRRLRLAEPARDYEQMLDALGSGELIVIMGPEQMRVVPAQEMYRQLDEETIQQTGQPEMRFLGEEKITGSFISMGMEQPPMVVFVNLSQQPALGDRGQYSYVADRLRTAEFDVREWNPGGGQQRGAGQFQRSPQPQQAEAAGPPPEPAPGQPAVWVVLPDPQQDPMAQAGGGETEAVAELLERRAERGDGVMTMLAYTPSTQTEAEDPIGEWLGEWGVHPQRDRLVLRERQLGQSQRRSSSRIDVQRWPEQHPVTAALHGIPGTLVYASPMELVSRDGVEQSPLIEARAQRLWSAADLQGDQTPYDPDAAADAILVAAAAERDNARLIAVADPFWASNTVTTIGGGQRGGAEHYGADYPGNSELFVNSMYWLAGYDGLIAASPRTQDLRRIAEMSNVQLVTYRVVLLAGLPLACLVAGLGVWLVRRRA